jgi:pimeloyl-ACP methyl ester carboxylesterase
VVATVVERFADNDGVKIRYLSNDPHHPVGLPVVFVPGIVDFADDYGASLECFADRRLFVVEMRGRGGSEAPLSGYSPQEQASDVEAMLEANAIGPFHLMTFSRGTTPGLELAFKLSDRVRTVSIGDYLPAEIALPPDFVARMWSAQWRGRPNSARLAGRHVLDGIQAASRPREFWTELASLEVPVLLARGSEGGIIDDERETTYRRLVPRVEVVTIAGSGHDLFRPSRTAYPEAVLEFIARRAPGT